MDNTESSWTKLEVGNYWGLEYYAREPRNEMGFCNHRVGINFPEGHVVYVRWPDGSTSEEKITYVSFEAHTSDHGHISRFHYVLAVIKKEFLGLTRIVKLNEVELWGTTVPPDGDPKYSV